MPKRIKEINNFGLGIVLNASEKDIPIDSASYSLNVEPDTKDGILGGIMSNRFIGASSDSFSRAESAQHRGVFDNGVDNPNNHKLPAPDTEIFRVQDYSKFTPRTGQLSYLSTKGDLTKLSYTSIVPHMERFVSERTQEGPDCHAKTYATFKPTSSVLGGAVDKYAEEIVIGPVTATQTITFSGTGTSNGEQITIRSIQDNKSVTYNAHSSDNTGVNFQIDGSDATVTCANLKAAIEREANHGYRITVVQTGDALTLTQYKYGRIPSSATTENLTDVAVDTAAWNPGEDTTDNLRGVINPGDVIRFTTETTNFKLTHEEELMRVLSFEEEEGTTVMVVERGYLGSVRKTYSNSTSYNIWINRMSFNGNYGQITTDNGYFLLPRYNEQQTGHRNILKGTTTDYNSIVGGTLIFDSAAKTVFGSLGSNVVIGAYVTFYKDGSLNDGFKTLVENIDGTLYYLKDAPQDETWTNLGDEKITTTANRDMSDDTGDWTDSAACTYDAANDEWDVNKSSGGSDEDVLTWSDLEEFTPIVGRSYLVEFEIKNYTSGSLQAYLGTATGTVRTANGVYKEYIKCIDNTAFKFRTTTAGSANQVFSIDNVSVKEEKFGVEGTLINNGNFWHTNADGTFKGWEGFQYGISAFSGNVATLNMSQKVSTLTEGVYSDATMMGSFDETTVYPYAWDGVFPAINITGSITTALDFELTENITDLDTIIPLAHGITTGAAGGRFVERSFAKGDVIKIDSELMKVTAVERAELTVIRGYDNTSPASHSSSASIDKSQINGIRQSIASASIKKDTYYELSFWVKGKTGVTAKAILTPQTATLSNYLSGGIGYTFQLESYPGTIKTYQFYNEGSGYTNGTLDGNNNIIVNINGDSNVVDIGNTIKGAIESNDGHKTEFVITVNGSSGAVTIEDKIAAKANSEIETNAPSNVFTILGQSGTVNAFDGGRPPKGAFALSYNKGFFTSEGIWKENVLENATLGYGIGGGVVALHAHPAVTWKYIDFEKLENSFHPSMAIVELDNYKWQKLVYRFKTPSEMPREDLVVEFVNNGDATFTYTLSNVDLLQSTHLLDASIGKGLIESCQFVDNSLIMYDSEDETLKSIENFDDERRKISEEVSNLVTSTSGKLLAPSSNRMATFVKKNREVHVGFGSAETDAAPQWVGYVNHKVFGTSYSSELYVDSDAVPQYDKEGINTLSKITVAGEYEKVQADYVGSSTNELTLSLTAQPFIVGDNIVLREYLDTANKWDGKGVWVVTEANANDLKCKRNIGRDNLLSVASGNLGFDRDRDGTKDNATGYVNVKPFYYYAIKKGEPFIYRIQPDDLFTGAAAGDVSTIYKAGKIQRSQDLGFEIMSICTSYSKNGSGTDGGYVYLLGQYGDKIYRMNVSVGFDKWKSHNFVPYETIQMKYRSFKWSNDHINGNIGGTTEVFGGFAHESSPEINPAGVVSDIIETKGPMITCDLTKKDTSHADVAPDKFDTRIWCQFTQPDIEDAFGEGDRFLFCGKSEFNAGEKTVYMADRTPPTTALYGMHKWSYGASRHGKSGFTTGPWHGHDSTQSIGDGKAKTKGRSALFDTDKNSNFTYIRPYTAFDFATESPLIGADNPSLATTSGIINYTPYVNLGYNVGWDARSTKDGGHVAIKTARYGLFAISDNDGDGLLDGLGVVIPSKKYQDGDDFRRYGNLHQRVSAHAVGMLAESDAPWIGFGGKWNGYTQSGRFTMETNSNGTPTARAAYSEDCAYNLKMNKFVFTAADMHFGDPIQKQFLTVSNLENVENPTGQGNDFSTKVTTSVAHDLQAGDLVYFKGSGPWDGWNQAATVIATDGGEPTKFWINQRSTTGGGTSAGCGSNNVGKCYIGGFLMNKRKWMSWQYVFNSTGTATNNNRQSVWNSVETSAGRHKSDSFHYAFNTGDPSNGTIFNNHGHFGPTWYTDQQNLGGMSFNNGAWPAYQFRIERLNWLAGFTMRPFDMDDEAFNNLVLGKSVSIDLPSFPGPVYRGISDETHSTDRQVGLENNTAYHYNTNKLFLTNPGVANAMGDVDDASLYQCNWSFLYPNKSSYQPLDTGLIRFRHKTGAFKWRVYYRERQYKTDDINGGNPWEVGFAGNLISSHTTGGTSNRWEYNSLHQPAVKLNMSTLSFNSGMASHLNSYTNSLAGLMITIVDATTGGTITRKIVASHPDGSDHWVVLHSPIYETSWSANSNDTFYVWRTNQAATAPVRVMKRIELRHGGNDVMKKSQDLYGDKHGAYFPSSGTFTVDSGGIFTCDEKHCLTQGDEVRIDDTTDYDGTYTINFLAPTVFSVTGLSGTAGTGEWSLLTDTTSSAANPVKIPLLAPAIKMMYGGLDFRKNRHIKHIASQSLGGGELTLDTGAAGTNIYQTGETYIVNHPTPLNDQEGNQVIERVDDDQFKYKTSFSAGSGSDVPALYNSGWGGIGASSTGASVVGNIKTDVEMWDKGNMYGNINRYDATDNSRYINVTEVSFEVKSGAPGDQPNDYFLKNTPYRYKVSLIYDGYQEGPLSEGSWIYESPMTRANLEVKCRVKKFSRRMSHLCIYRKDTSESFYRLVKQISTASSWSQEESGAYVYNLVDTGKTFASYEARTGISEINTDLGIKYGFSTELGGYLFAGDCSHSQIKNATNMIFRSKAGRFSLFDWASDFVQLKSPPTAMVGYLGKLWVFDSNNIFKINPHSLAIEDTFEGVGCSGPNSVIATEFGLFFANKSGAYFHNGSVPKKISGMIQSGGETNMLSISSSSTAETTNVEDLSWNNTAGNIYNKAPYVSYDAKRNAVYFIVEFKDDDGEQSDSRSYIWVFSIDKSRWDLWELANNDDVGKPFLGKNGEIYVGVGNGIYEVTGGSDKKKYSWLSKKFVMDTPSIKKVYTKVKVNGTNKNLNVGDDKLIVATDTGRVVASDIVYKLSGNDSADYRLKSKMKTGKWCQFKLEDMESEIDSIALIYRLRAIK